MLTQLKKTNLRTDLFNNLDSQREHMTQPKIYSKDVDHPQLQLDSIDRHIVEFLLRRGRATHIEVGDEVGLSPSAAYRRIQALESNGIIRGYQAEVDQAALGFGITVMVLIRLESQSAACLEAFENAVTGCSNVSSCLMMAGELDYLLGVCVADVADYQNVHKDQLSRLPGVARVESSFVVKTVVSRRVRLPQ
jgi:Lrp/AsnC family transcriptional regulator, leucine-responsive regulatory protein